MQVHLGEHLYLGDGQVENLYLCGVSSNGSYAWVLLSRD